MKAVCWYGIRDVRVLDVPEPRILNPRDAIVEVTSTTICGSDLHIYDGYVPTMRQGDILGHEFMGRVVEVGSGVSNLRVGDRVVVPFTISCGECFYCQRGMWSLCDNSNPNAWMAEKVFGYTPAGLYGYSHLMGGYAGGQAEYVRVPFADIGPLRIPDGLSDEQVLLISDVFATGYMAAEACDIQPGDTVAVWGCGPVGQMAIRSATHLGAARVIAIDAVPERLEMARQHGGAETINYAERRNVVEALKEMTAGRGPDACIDAVGMEALGRTVDALYDRIKQAVRLETGRPHALREAIQACRKGGTISIAGVYVGLIDKVPMGAAFNKGLTLKMGQTHVQKYMRPLLDLVRGGEIDPSYLFTHTMGLDEAPQAYAMFAAREAGMMKVMLKPEMGAVGDGRRARRERAMEQPVEMPISLPETGRGSPAQRESGARVMARPTQWGAEGTEAPPVPSQAEGTRATIEEDLCEKGLSTPEECAELPAEETPEQLVTGRHLPSQAEGERETVEETLRAREERDAAETERLAAERRLPSQAEGTRETVEEDLCEKGLAPPEECEELPAEGDDRTTLAPHPPSQAEGERETVEEDLRRLDEGAGMEPPPPVVGEAEATPPEGEAEFPSVEESVRERVRRVQEEAEEPRDTLDEGLDEEETR